MSYRIQHLTNRLTRFGYGRFEINAIIKDAIGIACTDNLSMDQSVALISHLEKYEQLGLNYINTYSK